MRIISGIYGGRRFSPPSNMNARPTTDVAREALFNILQNDIELDGLTVLDLFAGTGAVSFEFLSRGARRVVSVEMARQQATFIRDVAQRLKVPAGSHRLIVGNALSVARSHGETFDLVFADPPYALPELPTLPDVILAPNSPLRAGGTFILEHGSAHDFASHPCLVDSRRYGAVHFSIFKKESVSK